MKGLTVVLVTCAYVAGAAMPAQATVDQRSDRFANTEPLETIARSRAGAGAAAVLLEALRWRGRTA